MYCILTLTQLLPAKSTAGAWRGCLQKLTTEGADSYNCIQQMVPPSSKTKNFQQRKS